jgi:CheY-like chemotaxis protein
MIMPTRLLVEDERIIAFDPARRLTKLGYTVLATAGSGREAIQQAADLRPDLVLMDVGLPGGMDGLEAAAHIQAQAATPIMYLTGSPEGVIPAGFTIQKPVTDQAMHQTIQLALATRDRQAPGTPDATEGCGGQDGSPLGAASGHVRGAMGSGPQSMKHPARLVMVENERVIALDLSGG